MKHPALAQTRSAMGGAVNSSQLGSRGLAARWGVIAAAWLAFALAGGGGSAAGADCNYASGNAFACSPTLDVADAPPYLLKAARPNLLITLDNTDSMLWTGSDALVGYAPDQRELTSAATPIYYDPELLYLPPIGPDGIRYPSAAFDQTPRDFFRDQFCSHCQDPLSGALGGTTCATLCPATVPTNCTLNLETHYAAVRNDAVHPCVLPTVVTKPGFGKHVIKSWLVDGKYIMDPDHVNVAAASNYPSAPASDQGWALLCMYDDLPNYTTSDTHLVNCPAYYYRLRPATTYVDGGTTYECSERVPAFPKTSSEASAWISSCLERVVVGSASDLSGTSAEALTARTQQLLDCPAMTGSADVKLAKCNFANWYAFYRSKWRTLQSSLSRVLAPLEPSVRVGYQAMKATEVTGTDDYFTRQLLAPFGAFTSTRRAALFDWLFATNPDAPYGTPLLASALRVLNFYKGAAPYLQDPHAAESADNPVRACRNNFHLLFSDGSWTAPDSSIVPGWLGDEDGTAKTLPSSSAVGALTEGAYAASLGVTSYNIADPLTRIYRDANSQSLADLVFYSWITDLRPSNSATVPTLIADPTYTLTNKEQVFWNPKNDPADWQHVTTFTVGFGLQGKVVKSADAAKQGVYPLGSPADTQKNIVADGFPRWGYPATTDVPDDQDKVDDLWHAGVNGRGGFSSAQNPASLIASFEAVTHAVSKAAAKSASAAAVVNTGSLHTGRVVYQAMLNTETWTGDLRSYRIAPGTDDDICSEFRPGGVFCEDPALDYFQSAADHLNGNTNRNPPVAAQDWATQRSIATGTPNGQGAGSRLGDLSISTGLLHGLSNAQRDAFLRLLVGPTATATTGLAQATLDFIAGDRQYEARRRASTASYTFRDRDSLMGDIINGAPVFVTAPHRDLNADGYAAWAATAQNRTEIIYVGANDGMLHALDAGTSSVTGGQTTTVAGTLKELFAYVPRPLFGKLHLLTKTGYGATTVHTSFVDGPIAEGDVKLSDGWTSVVVGALGLGAQGVYAIRSPSLSGSGNITDAQTRSIHLWDFTDQNDPNMGYVLGEPTIAQVRMSGGSTKWVAIFGNGVNSSEDDGARAAGCDVAASNTGPTTCGQAVLYILDMQDGSLIARFLTTKGLPDDLRHTGTLDDPTTTQLDESDPREPNGLSQPMVVSQVLSNGAGDLFANGDPIATVAYAGDLFGNLWRFNLLDLPTGVGAGALYPELVFTATEQEESAKTQAITAPVLAAPHPTNVGRMLLFGTGRYLGLSDVSNTSIQTFYGIWDWKPLASGRPSTVATTGYVPSTSLQPQYVKETDIEIATTGNASAAANVARTSTRVPIQWPANPPTVTGTESLGWRLDLGVAEETPTEARVGGKIKIEVALTGERVVTAPLILGQRVLFVSMVPEVDQCKGGGFSWLNAVSYESGAALDYSPFDYDGNGTFDSKDLVPTADGEKEVGTSIRQAGMGKGIGSPAGPQGALTVTGPEPVLVPWAWKWRVWRQVP